MILADKIINERKKNGWSQEELAEMLSVSRQSVSKWEGAQSVPDLNKIIKMAEIFNVSTDYLLKDEIEEDPSRESAIISSEEEVERNIRKVSLEEAIRYINTVKKNTPSAVIATMLFVLCPTVLLELSAVASFFEGFISFKVAAAIGLIALFICLLAGVLIWIGIEIKEKEFNFLDDGDFETLYGVDGVVKEKKKEFDSKRVPCVFAAVTLFILCPIGVLTAGFMGANGFVIVSMVVLLLMMVAAGVGLFIYTSRIGKTFKNLLMEEKLTDAQKKAKKINSKLTGSYWCLVVAVYIVLGLGFNLRGAAGILFPVAGVLYAAIFGIVKIFTDK